MHVRRPSRRHAGMVLAGTLALAASLVSLRVGSVTLPAGAVIGALFDYDPGVDAHVIVRELRLGRTLVGVGVGAALGVAGCLAQAATRNPLVEPGILGVNAGAALAAVVAVKALGIGSPAALVWFALAGGLAAAGLVLALGGGDPATPVRLALAGVVVGAVFSSWTALLLLRDEHLLDAVRFWLFGSLSGAQTGGLAALAPPLLAALTGALALGRQLDVLVLGDDAARALGQRVSAVRSGALGLAVALAAVAVAAAGPVGFVGLAAPHLARHLAGRDHRLLLATSALVGPALVLGADVVGRVVLRPAEVPVGIVTALGGAPLLVWLARRDRGAAG